MTMEAERERLEDPTVNFEDGESGQELRYTGGIWKVGNARKQNLPCSVREEVQPCQYLHFRTSDVEICKRIHVYCLKH